MLIQRIKEGVKTQKPATVPYQDLPNPQSLTTIKNHPQYTV